MQKQFKPEKIKQARVKAGMTRADLVRAIAKRHPLISNQLVYLWETQGVVPSLFYQEIIIKTLERDARFFYR